MFLLKGVAVLLVKRLRGFAPSCIGKKPIPIRQAKINKECHRIKDLWKMITSVCVSKRSSMQVDHAYLKSLAGSVSYSPKGVEKAVE